MSNTKEKTPSALINALAEEGTMAEAIEWLQKAWSEKCALGAKVVRLKKELAVARCLTDAAIEDYNDAREQVIGDMRRHLPEHPPLRGPIEAFLDAYEKDHMK